MTIHDLSGHKYLKMTVVCTNVVNRAAVRSPLDRIDHGIKHTELV